jgi:hypothetical protein
MCPPRPPFATAARAYVTSFPLRAADKASVVLNLADDRHRLEQLLGVDRGLFAELQSGPLMLGPLLGSAAAAFLPG